MPNEGDIVRNKRTGETAVWSGGRAVPMGGAAPAGPVYGPPPTPEKPKVFDPPAGYTGDPSGLAPIPGGPADPARPQPMTAKEQAEQTEKDKKSALSRQDAISKLHNVIGKIDEVAFDSADNDGWGETGLTGSIMRTVPGTAGFDLASNVKTIDANAAFNALAEMRQNSPTGGALGQVTEKELDLLKSSISNLDTAQGQEQFLKNLAEAKKIYLEMLGRLDPDARATFNNKRGLRFREDGTVSLVYVDGEDDRPERDPFGIRGNEAPPPTGGGGGNPIAAGLGDAVQMAGDTLGIVANPLNATVNAAFGTDFSTDLGRTLRDASGLPDGNPTISAINRGAMGAMTLSGVARQGAKVATGITQNALNTFGARPIADAGAAVGAAGGAELARANNLGTTGQIGGAIVGGLAGGAGVNALAGAVAPKAPNALAQASQRQGVNMLPADAGGTVAKMFTSGAKASPLSAGPIRAQAQTITGQVKAAAGRHAAGQGEVLTTDKAGQSIRGAAERFTKQTSERGAKLYDRAYEASKGVKIKPLKTLAALDEQIARASQNPVGADLAKQLKSFRDSIAGGVSIQGLRDARTMLSAGVYDGKLRSGADQAIWKSILGNVADDVDGGLRQVGRNDAAGMFRVADKFWAERVEHIDQVLQPILGAGKSGEDIVKNIETMARGGSGGNARLSRLLANMEPQEAGQIRATIIDRIGRAKPGQQTADGEAFSAATFLTNWSSMTKQAKASLFSDPSLRRNLDDIAVIAENMKATSSMANHSNTAMAVTGGGNAIGAVALGAAAHPLAALFVAGAQVVTGKLLASPGFAKMLARTAKMPPGPAQRSMVDQLKVLTTREPLIRNDARALQQHLEQTFGQSPVRAAAGEKEQD